MGEYTERSFTSYADIEAKFGVDYAHDMWRNKKYGDGTLRGYDPKLVAIWGPITLAIGAEDDKLTRDHGLRGHHYTDGGAW